MYISGSGPSFSLASPSTPSPTPVSPSPTTLPTPTPPAKSTPIGAIVGGVVGGLAVIALVAIAVVLFIRRRSPEGQQPAPQVAAQEFMQTIQSPPMQYDAKHMSYMSSPVSESHSPPPTFPIPQPQTYAAPPSELPANIYHPPPVNTQQFLIHSNALELPGHEQQNLST
jgi:hypothetical protein